MKKSALISIILALMTEISLGQIPPPELGEQPTPPAANWIEVRFAINKKAVKCEYFYLSAKIKGKEFFSGKFSSGFKIPSDIPKIPGKDSFELEIKCNNYQWHFKNVGDQAFSEGYWWIGTDYPPLQERLQWPAYKDTAWIHYLIFEPSIGSGFIEFKRCTKHLEDKKPGPCYED